MSTFVDELIEVGIGEVLDRDLNNELSEETLRQDGTQWKLLLDAASVMGAEVYFQTVDRFNGLFLNTASFEKLSRWVADRYGVVRLGATSGVVSLTFSRTTTTSEITIAGGTTVSDPSGTVKFETDEDLELAIGVASASVDATSTATGRDQRAEANTLTQIEGSLPQPDLTVNNPQKAAGGNDGESDFDLRARARGIFVNARRGTLSAIRQGCFTVAGVRDAAVYEYRHPNGCATGIVGVVVSDQSGNCNDALVDLVSQVLDEWRGAGIQVIVNSATPRLESIEVTPFYETGSATPALKRVIRQTIVAFVNSLTSNAAETTEDAPEDSWLTPGLIESAVRSVTGVSGVSSVTLPSGIIKPAPKERILTTTGLITVN